MESRYIEKHMFFHGYRYVDGCAFDTPENRPAHVQNPLARQK